MGKLFILFYDITVFAQIILGGLAIFMLVQLISYRGFGFNLYKTILKYINKELYYERR